MIDHDRLANRAIRRMIAKYGAAECLRRMLSCPDQHAMPFDVIEGCRAVAVQCGDSEELNERELE
jgi:hypothetical protein